MSILPPTVFVCGLLKIFCGFQLNLIHVLLAKENVEQISMVFFHNVKPGARVQVKWRGEIENGTIRYAGNLVAKDGDWVGVELDNRGNVNCGFESFLGNFSVLE